MSDATTKEPAAADAANGKANTERSLPAMYETVSVLSA